MNSKKTTIITLLVSFSCAMVLGNPRALVSNNLKPFGRGALISNSLYNKTVRVDSPGESYGQTFKTKKAFDLRTITLIKSKTTRYRPGHKLRLNIFKWNPLTDANDISEWKKGQGIQKGEKDALKGTGMKLLYSYDFEIPKGTMTEGNYIHMEMDKPVPLEAETAYAFTYEFIQGKKQKGPRFFLCLSFNDTEAYNGGREIQTTSKTNKSAKSEDLAFFIGDAPMVTEVKQEIVNYEYIKDKNLVKLTVNSPFPDLCYIMSRENLTDPNGWWKGIPHSPDGTKEFKETNLTYSSKDNTGNHVIYINSSRGKDLFKVGDKPLGNIEALVYKSGKNALPYRILKPNDYDSNTKYPLVIALHGAGGVGTDNTSRSIEAWRHLSTPEIRKKYPAFVITPQSKSKWANTPWSDGSYSIEKVPITIWITMLHELIGKLKKKFNIDEDRIYVIGQSMGGFGAYDCVMRNPGLFAALVPMAGGGDPTQAKNMKNVAIWMFHGARDKVVPVSADREMAEALKAAEHSNWTYTEYPKAGHAVTIPAWADKKLIPWIFSQKRETTKF